jgi:hypothetical protein
MNRVKTTMMLMARWLVVFAASLIVSSGNFFASASPKAKSTCDASCAARCPCCISKSAPVNSSAPLAPAPSTRTAGAKDFQLVPLLAGLLAPERVIATPISSQSLTPHFPSFLPVFVRHCTFLI